MNISIILDRLSVSIASVFLGKKKYFSKSSKSHFFEIIDKAMTIDLPELGAEGTYNTRISYQQQTLNGSFRIEQWLGDNYPTIIYHHGNNERPYDYGKTSKNTFFSIFVKEKTQFKANIIVVQALFHDLKLSEYQEKMTTLENFMLMIAASVKMNELIIQKIRANSKKHIYTCGISLGGWVTNLHRSIYDTSSAYIPLLAGTFLGHLFTESYYKKLLGKEGQKNADDLRILLNFDVLFRLKTTANVYPLLAEYDQFIEYDVQKNSYPNITIKTIKAGHITAVLKTKILRDHILSVLDQSSPEF